MRKYYLIPIILLIIAILIFISIQIRSPTTGCDDLSEEECSNNEKCRGSYSQTSSCPICADVIYIFEECLEILDEEFEQAKIDKELCERAMGEWKRTDYIEIGNPFISPAYECWCPQGDFELYYDRGSISFVENRGCVSNKIICEENEGIWEKGEISSTEIFYPAPIQDECIIEDRYRILEWDEEEGVCIQKKFNNPKCMIDGEEMSLFDLDRLS